LALAELLRLVIRSWALLDIPFDWWNDPLMLIVLPFIPLVLGFLAGLYPSFYLTTFRPIQVLKGKIASGLRNQGFRNGLVTVQFAISIALLASTVFVFQQLEFMRSRNLGYDKENILVVNQADKLGPQLQSFRDQVSTIPGVVNASIAFDMPGRGRWEDIFHKEGDDTKLPLTQIKIDEHYFRTMGLSPVAGRSFDKDRPSDKNAAILNETAVALFGWTPEEALGKKVLYMGDDMGAAEVIGVVNDFNFQSLRENIAPLIFYNIESTMWGSQRVLAIKFSGNPQALISSLEAKWKQTLDDTPFHFSFLDQELAQQYLDETRLAGLFAIFTSLSILIAVIGLIGMVAYTVEQRKKEISVRKVFGASTGRILVLLNKQYIKVIAVSMAIATPLVLWMMNEWLSGYAYRITLNPVVFVGAGILEIILALGCVSYLCIKAARTNPAVVLKEE
ncbi:MAG TPA: FtsX-like permease family protein, partial [Ohtaekwangia sp.]|nr:FtsX-like permease family protein [Ohtaekwangia sp.]